MVSLAHSSVVFSTLKHTDVDHGGGNGYSRSHSYCEANYDSAIFIKR